MKGLLIHLFFFYLLARGAQEMGAFPDIVIRNKEAVCILRWSFTKESRSLLAEIPFKKCILFTLKQKWNDETSFPECFFLLCNLAMSKKREEMLPSCRQWRYSAERLKAVMIPSKQWNFHCKILAVSGRFDCETLHPFLKLCPMLMAAEVECIWSPISLWNAMFRSLSVLTEVMLSECHSNEATCKGVVCNFPLQWKDVHYGIGFSSSINFDHRVLVASTLYFGAGLFPASSLRAMDLFQNKSHKSSGCSSYIAQ